MMLPHDPDFFDFLVSSYRRTVGREPVRRRQTGDPGADHAGIDAERVEERRAAPDSAGRLPKRRRSERASHREPPANVGLSFGTSFGRRTLSVSEGVRRKPTPTGVLDLPLVNLARSAVRLRSRCRRTSRVLRPLDQSTGRGKRQGAERHCPKHDAMAILCCGNDAGPRRGIGSQSPRA
jgi:hypothetical protein